MRYPGWFPRKLILSELLGGLQSPFAYLEAQSQARKLAAIAGGESEEVEEAVMAGGVQ